MLSPLQRSLTWQRLVDIIITVLISLHRLLSSTSSAYVGGLGQPWRGRVGQPLNVIVGFFLFLVVVKGDDIGAEIYEKRLQRLTG